MTLQGLSYNEQKPIVIHFDDSIETIEPSREHIKDFFIGPGLVDLQVNGYGGSDYNQLYDDPAQLRKITYQLFAEGVTTHLPTIITNSANNIKLLIRQVIELRKNDEYLKSSVEGLHIEGPFISPDDGPRGAHPKEHVRSPDFDLILQWQDAAEGLIKIVTLSPEWENSNSFIERCIKHNIIVSIGHTRATHQQIEDAIKAGATLSTHLGNGMHPNIVRHPNYLWSQLANDNLTPSIIADGFHLPVEVIKVFLKTKGEKIFLVSDCVSLAGMPPGDYDLHIGGQVTLTSEGKLHLRGNPNIFAGSASNLRSGVSFLVINKLMDLAGAWAMASVRPYQILHPTSSIFKSGAKADLIQFGVNQNQIEVKKTFKRGKLVFSRD